MPSAWPLLLPLLMANVFARPTPLPSSASPNSCRMPQPLGMESGAIGDDQLSASSSFDEASLGPAMARIRGERGGGAWCPDRQIHVDSYEFVQVDLLAPFEIWAVEVQGRYGNGSGREFAEALMLDYIGPARRNWTRYTATDSNETVANQLEGQVLPANEDERTAELIPLVPPMLASSIRLVPFSVQLRTVCIRFELWGCPILMNGGTPGDDAGSVMDKKKAGDENADIGHQQHWSRHILERPALLYSLAVLLALLPLGLFLLLLRRLLQLHRKSSSSSGFFSCSSSRTSSTATQSALRPSSSWQNVLLPFPFDNSMPGASAKIFSPSFCRFDTVSMGWPSLRRAPGSILGREMSDQPKNGIEEGNWANGLGQNGISAGGTRRRAQSCKAMTGQGQQKMGRKRQQPMLPAVPAICPTVRATVHQLAHSCSQPESFVTRPMAAHPQNGLGGKKPMPKPRSILFLNQQQQQQNGTGMDGCEWPEGMCPL